MVVDLRPVATADAIDDAEDVLDAPEDEPPPALAPLPPPPAMAARSSSAMRVASEFFR